MGERQGRVRFVEESRKPSPRPAHLPPAEQQPQPAHQLQQEAEEGLQTVDIKLGLLVKGGIYTTDVLEYSAPADGSEPRVQDLQEPNIALSSAAREASSPGRRALVLRLLADREGPFATSFTVELAGQQVAVNVSATVMPRRKGHPALRPHVHQAGYAVDADTEAGSDWHGFD